MIRRLIPATAALALGACSSQPNLDPSQQVGPNPVLPKPVEGLIAAVGVPKVVGWKTGETQVVPRGFHI